MEPQDNSSTELHPQEASLPTEHPTPTEIGGRKGLDPVRFGDWELNGKCVDF